MGHDPQKPGYQPEYTGETDDGDVGSGSTFGADLYALYAAGRVHLPEAALVYEQMTEQLHGLQPLMARCAEAAGLNLGSLLEDRDTLQFAFRKTSLHLAEAGDALVRIADDYVRTDEAAAEEFGSWLRSVGTPYERERFAEPPVAPPDPPGNDDPRPDIGNSPHGTLEPGD